MGAICKTCHGAKLKVDGCKPSVFVYDGKKYPRIKAGDKGDLHEIKSSDAENSGKISRCHGCGAKYGHYHHENCDVEQCPICGEQLLSCKCKADEVFIDLNWEFHSPV